MSSDEKRRIGRAEDTKTGLASTQYLIQQIERLQVEVENLRGELKGTRSVPSGKIGTALIVPGALVLLSSVIYDSQVLAFIGLGLIFWGALLFFLKPRRYIESALLSSTATPSYSTIDRIIKDLKYGGKSYYVPPYPADVYLPEHLKGLKDMIVFVARTKENGKELIPSIEEIAKGKFLLKNPKGICLTPPGIGLLDRFEKELRTNITTMEIDELFQVLPALIIENLQLAKQFEITQEKNQILLKISDSIYENMYVGAENLKSVHLLGCPLVSGIVCAVAMAAGRTVVIQRDEISLDGRTIEFWCGFVGG